MGALCLFEIFNTVATAASSWIRRSRKLLSFYCFINKNNCQRNDDREWSPNSHTQIYWKQPINNSFILVIVYNFILHFGLEMVIPKNQSRSIAISRDLMCTAKKHLNDGYSTHKKCIEHVPYFFGVPKLFNSRCMTAFPRYYVALLF